MTVSRSIDEFLRLLMALQDGGRLTTGRQGYRAATCYGPGPNLRGVRMYRRVTL